MKNLYSNVTLNSSKHEGPNLNYVLSLSLFDILTLLMGQPVVATLLWITFTSKKSIDILNCNLALFHNLQYLFSIVHFIVLVSLSHNHKPILEFVFVYVQIGGPMSLSFICLERYVAVIHPSSYPLLKKYRCREVCAGTVWLFSVPSALASVLAPETSSTVNARVLKTLPFFTMVAMAAMMVWCSRSIARALRKSGPGRDELHPLKRRALKTVRTTSIVTLFCYIPVTVLQQSLKEDESHVNIYVITPICIFFLSAASVVHPLFYISTHRKLFTCLKGEKKDK